jgi:hypothetical protein
MGVRVTRSSVPSSIGTDTVETADIQDNAVTLDKMAGITRGSIIYGDASGDPAALAKGTNTYVLSSDGTDIAWAAPRSASATVVGASELATAAEINTSTDAARTMTPGAFSDSNYGIRYIQVIVADSGTALTTGDGKTYIHIPAGLNGMDLMEVHAEVQTAPAGSTITIEISKNGASTQMLSTNITIDASETGSDTAATAAVIQSNGNEAVATNDVVQINITQIGSSTAGSGLMVTMGFRIP